MRVVGGDHDGRFRSGLEHAQPVRRPVVGRAYAVEDVPKGVVDDLTGTDRMFDPAARADLGLVQTRLTVVAVGEHRT
jgi:hypothetical protein